jgi:hypothetical protein
MNCRADEEKDAEQVRRSKASAPYFVPSRDLFSEMSPSNMKVGPGCGAFWAETSSTATAEKSRKH